MGGAIFELGSRPFIGLDLPSFNLAVSHNGYIYTGINQAAIIEMGMYKLDDALYESNLIRNPFGSVSLQASLRRIVERELDIEIEVQSLAKDDLIIRPVLVDDSAALMEFGIREWDTFEATGFRSWPERDFLVPFWLKKDGYPIQVAAFNPSGQMVGLCGTSEQIYSRNRFADSSQFYCVSKDHRGKDLARNLSLACAALLKSVQPEFETLSYQILADNFKSIRVANKVGMSRDKRFDQSSFSGAIKQEYLGFSARVDDLDLNEFLGSKSLGRSSTPAKVHSGLDC